MPAQLTPQELDEVFRLLAVTDRRRVLRYLQVHEEASVSELADVLTGWKAVERGELTGPADREAIETSLVHVQLPKLSEAGFVEYDAESRTVSGTDLPDWVHRLLDAAFEATETAGTETQLPDSHTRS